MSSEPFEYLKKSMNATNRDPRLLPHVLDELRFFFRLARVQLESGNPLMRESAATEIRALKKLLEEHPLLKKKRS